jgi:diguanylate cyclase (GGDEF)-like protein
MQCIVFADLSELGFDHAPLGMMVLNQQGDVLLVNATLRDWFDPAPERLEPWLVNHDQRAFKEFLSDLPGLGQSTLEVRLEIGAVQRWVRLHAKVINETIILGLEDISKLKRSQADLEYLFYFDALTGLPNRSMLVRQLEVMLTSARRRFDTLALAFIDLDRFKLVNDTFGYGAGDDLLRAVGERLKLCLRNTDLLVRMGGDEYAMLLLGDEAYAGHVARRVLESLSEPFTLTGQELLVSACLGVALYPQDAQDNAQLQAHADLAMFHAKEQGRGRIRFYGSNEHIERQQLELEAELRHAINNGELFLEYQPQFDVRDNRLIGFEALVRWQHPKHGRLSPGQFIPLAEQSGLIHPIGHWVLKTVAEQLRAWRTTRTKPIKIAVNISAVQLERPDLTQVIQATLQTCNVPFEQLDLEITESQILIRGSEAEHQLRDITALGVRLSVDDFGTGFSNLARLREIPLHALKIDRVFVKQLDAPDNKDTTALVRSIVQLAQNLELEVIGEGVENQEQLERLHFLGCNIIQGFALSVPLSASEAEKLL